MERADVGGIGLEYEVGGSATGGPVVFIHGAFVADTFRPLLAEPLLAGHYRLILYHRRGYAGSSHPPGPTSIAQQAALSRFGKHLGTAYQLIDDVLDYRSDPATRGKNLGDDLAEGKPTLPLLHALRHGNDEQRAVIRLAIEQGGLAQLGPIVEAIEATGGLEYATQFAQRETAQALTALAALPDSPHARALASLAMFAQERTS